MQQWEYGAVLFPLETWQNREQTIQILNHKTLKFIANGPNKGVEVYDLPALSTILFIKIYLYLITFAFVFCNGFFKGDFISLYHW